jgi:putative phosphoribosyl transferase
MRTAVPFVDRQDAGRRLAERLRSLASEKTVVLGLPRGGVPVAFEVAQSLHAPLDVLLVRKLGVPFQPELAMGAIGEDGVRVLNDRVLAQVGVSANELHDTETRERQELKRRAERYRGRRARVDLTGCTAILIDDGIATGSTARAACEVARLHGASRIVFASPVAPPSAIDQLRTEADEVVVLETPTRFYAIGQFYGDFSQTPDEEVVRLLEAAHKDGVDPPVHDEEIEVRIDDDVMLPGHLTVPEGASMIVLFAHGSGSSRHSPRNLFVAEMLNRAGLGTLLMDLLTRDEEVNRGNVFDIDLLADRLSGATEWLRHHPAGVRNLIGYFGASTGAAAALWTAAEPDAGIAAVVSRGGRPDLAGPRLAAVHAPTLFIVGGDDAAVLALNREAQARMQCETQLRVVLGATHLFEEPGALDRVAVLARDWFLRHSLRTV